MISDVLATSILSEGIELFGSILSLGNKKPSKNFGAKDNVYRSVFI